MPKIQTGQMPGAFPDSAATSGSSSPSRNDPSSSRGRTLNSTGLPTRRPDSEGATGKRRNLSPLSVPEKEVSYAAVDIRKRLDNNTRLAMTAGSEMGPLKALDKTLSFYPGRGIDNFFKSNALVPAVESLAAKHVQKVIVATGFSVDRKADGSPLPETDGPIGTAALVHALRLVGKTPILVTDTANYAPTLAALKVIDPKLAEHGMFIKFDHKQGEASVGAAQKILEDTHADAVVTIELPGRTVNGDRRNMRGVDISPFNGAVDELLIQANLTTTESNKKNVLTVSVGDGGNEAGMGKLKGIPNALNGMPMQAAEPAQHQVTASVSNLGGEALAAVLLNAYGKLDKLHTPQQQGAMIRATMEAGAVDGVTRGGIAGEKKDNGTTGVDGFHPDVHATILEALKQQVSLTPVNRFEKRMPAQPMLIAAFDSSDGGLHAVKVLNDLAQVRYPHMDIRFVPVLDHAKAPYGPRGPADLTGLVDQGLRTGAKLGVDVNMFACNTASTVLGRDQFKPGEPAAAVPYINLIKTTVDGIVEHGGAHPVIVATQGTVDSHAYRDGGAEKGVAVHEIAAPKWAEFINNNDIEKKQKGIEVLGNIAKIVDSIPPEATTVWLCCTHYSAFKTQIEDRLRETGRAHVQVINPMVSQLDATMKVVEEIYDDPGVVARRARRRMDLAPVVVTSAVQGRNQVQQSVDNLLGPDTAFVRTHFGENVKLELVNWHLNDPKVGTPLKGTVAPSKGAGQFDNGRPPLTKSASLPSFMNP